MEAAKTTKTPRPDMRMWVHQYWEIQRDHDSKTNQHDADKKAVYKRALNRTLHKFEIEPNGFGGAMVTTAVRCRYKEI